MNSFLNKNGVRVYSAHTSGHAPFCERFNYTLQTLIYRYICANNTYSFYKDFDKIVQNYNNKVHSALGISPNKAELPQYQKHVSMMHAEKFSKFRDKKKPKYKIGQLVRISIKKNKFSRGYGPQFTNGTFIIENILSHLPRPLYILKSADLNEEALSGKFYEHEIFAIKENQS